MLERYSNLTPVWSKGAGCELCSGTGYRGRVGVYELLVLTDSIRDLIVARATHHEIKAVAIEEGMRTMQQEAFDLVAKGLTTVEDVLRSVYAPGMDGESAPVGELEAGKLELDEGRSGLPEGSSGVDQGSGPDAPSEVFEMGATGSSDVAADRRHDRGASKEAARARSGAFASEGE